MRLAQIFCPSKCNRKRSPALPMGMALEGGEGVMGAVSGAKHAGDGRIRRLFLTRSFLCE